MRPVDVHPAVPVLVIGLLAFGLAAIMVRRSRFYHALVSQEISAQRFHSIDGLRGYLALGVLFHHVVINYHYYQTGTWELTPSRLNTFLGRGSVAWFFMITAFLFWNRAITAKGKIDAFRFYTSRLRRMVPMYLLSAGLVVVTALALTHFRLLESPLELLRNIMAWVLFTIPGVPYINTFSQTPLINTVFWSLVYEWKFYFLFPLLSIFAYTRGKWCLAALAALYIHFYSETQVEWFFLAGCAAAMLTRAPQVRKIAASWIGTAGAIAFIGATLEWQPAIYSPVGAVFLSIPFIVFASGNTMFGLLTCRPARMLGVLSYSIYLLHNWVLYLVSRGVNHYSTLSYLPMHAYWIVGALVAMLTVACAALTYRFVEYPFLRSDPSPRTKKSLGPVALGPTHRISHNEPREL